MRVIKTIFFILFLLTVSCRGTGLRESEYKKIKRKNSYREVLTRYDEEKLLPAAEDIQRGERRLYPWEEASGSPYPKITKDFFRCRGSSRNDSYMLRGKERIYDCTGMSHHSLPLRDGQEFIYPILIRLLNYFQDAFQCRMIITSGHRCPAHNRWCDPSEYNASSKHMIGAEVDFYPEGKEIAWESLVEALEAYYRNDPEVKEHPSYTEFRFYTKGDTNVSTPPRFNKEIFVKFFKDFEGRDPDNRHSHPYFSIQVRYDREKKEQATYTWQQAFYNYLRY